MEPSDAAHDDELPVVAVRHEVGREHRGASVLDVLDALWGPVDRRRVQTAARSGQVHLNGAPTGPSVTLRDGDLLELYCEPEELTRREETALPWLLRAEHLGVAAKPAGLPFDASRGRTGRSTIERLGVEGGRARPVHRLDKQTSGVVVVAFDRETEQQLGAALTAGEARVEYLAVVRGPLAEDEGCLDVPLSPGRRSDQGLHADPDHGQAARTHWRVEERLGHFALLRLWPEGGRSHQVRAHLAALGYPALGDARYGEDSQVMLSQLKLGYRPKRGRPERPLLARPAVHAERFVHPQAGLDVRAPLPHDLEVLLAQLRRLHDSGVA